MANPQAILIRRIERYCLRRAIALTTFGRHAVNDGKLIARLKDGRSITLATLRRIEAALTATAGTAARERDDKAAGGRRGTGGGAA
jgi:hypothetical protein